MRQKGMDVAYSNQDRKASQGVRKNKRVKVRVTGYIYNGWFRGVRVRVVRGLGSGFGSDRKASTMGKKKKSRK